MLENIRSIKSEKTHIIDSNAAKLALLLSEHQQTLNEKLKNYIIHIENLLKNLGKNISEIKPNRDQICRQQTQVAVSLEEDNQKMEQILLSEQALSWEKAPHTLQ